MPGRDTHPSGESAIGHCRDCRTTPGADKTPCTRAEVPIARLAGATTGKSPCTMRPIAQRPGCRAMRCLSLAGQCGRRRRKQESLRRCRQMHAKHADGPEPGMAVHGSDRGTTPWRAAPVRHPLPHPRVLRPSACICVKPCLLRRAPHGRYNGPRILRACQNPMHQFARLPPLGRPSRLGVDIIKRCQNPMHQFTGRLFGKPTTRAGKHPMSSGRLPDRRRPPSRQERT
jgi:hypothetical protein